jgi:CBS domain-containing protein
MLQAVVWSAIGSRHSAVRIAAWAGRAVAVLVGLATLVINSVISQNQPASIGTIGASAMGFAVAAFLWFGATQTLRSAELGERAATLNIGHLIRPAVYLPPSTPISEAVRLVSEAHAAGIVVVDADGRSRAIVREAQVSGLEPTRRPWATIADVACPLEAGLVLSDRINGAELLSVVQSHPATEYLVVGGDGVSRGIIATSDFARALGIPQPSIAS